MGGNLGAVGECWVCFLLKLSLSGEGQSPKPARGCCVTLDKAAEDTGVITASHPAGFKCRMWKCSSSALLSWWLLLGLLSLAWGEDWCPVFVCRGDRAVSPVLCRSLPFPPTVTASTTWWAMPGSGHLTGGLCTTPHRTSTTL